jgi:hypothetical protein
MHNDKVITLRGVDGIGLPSSEDMEPLYNSREWLRHAIEVAGGKVVGSGLGAGGADLEVVIDGYPFAISISPRNTD